MLVSRGLAAASRRSLRPTTLPSRCHRRKSQLASSAAGALAPEVRILEVGPRDGLQNIKAQVATPIKIELIRRLAATGLQAIEATSFVAPKWIPQLADGPDVMKAVLAMQESDRPFRYPVLVPNMKGFERAALSGAREAVVFASASEGFSWKNTNCSVEDALVRAEEVVAACLEQGLRARGVISCIFACPYDGPTEPSKVLAVAKRFLEMGCYEVGLGDTLGVGTPADTEKLLRVLLTEIPPEMLSGHYHDTYGQAVANVFKSYEMGLRAFDSSVAGLGGCPYAKGATGNAATEDLVYTLERAGVSTGVDLQQLSEVGQWITSQLGIRNNSRVGAALIAKGQSGSSTPAKKETSTPLQPLVSTEWRTLTDDGEHRVARSDNMVKVTLTRPRNGNALTNSMVESITKLYNDLANDPTVFQIILEAEGRFFCTGMDLSASGSSSSNDPAAKADYYAKVEAFFDAIQNSPQTTIAVIDKPCYGGGVGLAFSCDVRLCSANASFTMTEVTLGLSPAIISRQIVREWGVPVAREAMLSGRTVTATELQRLGAVHGIAESSDALQAMLAEYLGRLRRAAPRSATAIKQLTRLAWKDPGGTEQDRFIGRTFEKMMVPGSEGEHGMAQFRRKIKGIDWGHFWAQAGSRQAS